MTGNSGGAKRLLMKQLSRGLLEAEVVVVGERWWMVIEC